jgi:hypothetical protein
VNVYADRITLSPEQLKALAVLIGDKRRIVIESQNVEETLIVRVDGMSWQLNSKGAFQRRLELNRA